jgi:TorA maturation chaperone TorD
MFTENSVDGFTDKQLDSVRLHFIDVIKSLFISEPDADKFSNWRKFFAALVFEKINSSLEGSITLLNNMLSEKSLETIQDEYYQLFVNPYAENHLEMTLSSIIDGRNYGPALAELRGFLMEAAIEKIEKITESEDSLVVMLDSMATLIAVKNHNDGKEISCLNQDILLTKFLKPFSDKFLTCLQKNKKADFYVACAVFLNGYLDLEMVLIGKSRN